MGEDRGRLALVCAASSCSPPPPAYSGTVQTESVAVGSQIGGRVAEVNVSAGSRVQRGSVILRIDPGMLGAQYDQARAQVQQAAEHLAELQNGNVETDIERARAQSAQAAAQYRQAAAQTAPQTSAAAAAVSEAQAALTLARANLARTQSLEATGDVSKQSLDQAGSDFAKRKHGSNKPKPPMPTRSARNSRANSPARAPTRSRSRRTTRTSSTDRAPKRSLKPRPRWPRRKPRRIRSQTSGRGDHRRARVRRRRELQLASGRFARPESASRDHRHLRGSVRVHLCLAARLGRVDQRDARARGLRRRRATFDGTVEAFDRTAQFTPQNVETADQRADLVYGVKIRIHDPQHQLLSGTTVTVHPK